jgi:uncharacterized membrane protein
VAVLDAVLLGFTFAGAIGSAVIGGVFFAFSTFVMRALRRLAPGEGLVAMQAINIAVVNAVFLGAFCGTAGACLVAAAGAVLRWGRPGPRSCWPAASRTWWGPSGSRSGATCR